MKVTTLEKQDYSWNKLILIEHEGVEYTAQLGWCADYGYDLTFYQDGKAMDMPKWAEDYEDAEGTLSWDLDNLSEGWNGN